jgi:uroporphyrinogen decarboxylase
MTPKERFLTALKGGRPDCVPASPDMSNMVPCKMTGKPFWDLYLYGNSTRHLAYLAVLDKYQHEGAWETHCPDLDFTSTHDRREFTQEIVSRTDERIVARDTCRTPDGDLWQETVYYIADPPTVTRKWVKDFEREFPIFLKHFFPEPTGVDAHVFDDWRARVGDRGIVSLICRFPGYQDMMHYIDGNMEATTYSFYDYPRLWDQYREVYHDYMMKVVRHQIAVKPDFIFLTASGTLTLQSPEVFRKFGLPTVKQITRECKEAGIPTLLHSCGKETELVKICAEETDLSAINPLEISPMGDCDLKELKRRYGKKITLMGNLHTTEVMLRGTPDDVERAAKQAIDDAAEGGGFILSTGDQVPRDTPEENLYRFVQVAHEYGKYS